MYISSTVVTLQKQVYIEKTNPLWLLYKFKYPYDCFVVSRQHSVIMDDFIIPETQQPIIVITLIIYSPYLLKDFVEL